MQYNVGSALKNIGSVSFICVIVDLFLCNTKGTSRNVVRYVEDTILLVISILARNKAGQIH